MVDWDELDRLGAKAETGEQWADVCRLEDLLRSQGQLQFNFIPPTIELYTAKTRAFVDPKVPVCSEEHTLTKFSVCLLAVLFQPNLVLFAGSCLAGS